MDKENKLTLYKDEEGRIGVLVLQFEEVHNLMVE